MKKSEYQFEGRGFKEVTLSLSQYVRMSVWLYVCMSLFLLLVSLKFPPVFKSFNGVSKLFKGCLKCKGCVKEVLRVFTESFKGVSRKFRVFQGGFKRVSRKFQECFKEVKEKYLVSFK